MKLFELGLIVFWFLIDQVTKWWAVEYLMARVGAVRITPFFNLVLGWNRGISFGMLSDRELPPWVLACLSAAIVIGLFIWLFRRESLLVGTGLALIIAGALSNALDRLRHGAVIDFLDFHLAGWHWPAFNLADVGVVCGAVMLSLSSLFGSSAK